MLMLFIFLLPYPVSGSVCPSSRMLTSPPPRGLRLGRLTPRAQLPADCTSPLAVPPVIFQADVGIVRDDVQGRCACQMLDRKAVLGGLLGEDRDGFLAQV